ncbi:hypothetical protein GCM10020255_083910 [Rhodococcus baikonurensis]
MVRIPTCVKVVTLPSGATQYEVRIEAGKADGKLQQTARCAELQYENNGEGRP